MFRITYKSMSDDSPKLKLENSELITESDEILAFLHKNGNEQAYQVLVKRHLDGLFNFCMRYTHNLEDAEDITQDTFVKAWKKFSTYDSKYSFKTWLYSICKNTALDYLKKKKHAHFSEFEDMENLILEPAFIGTPDVVGAEDGLASRQIDQEMENLSPQDKNVLLMHYQEGYAFREIAEKIGRSANTVKTWHRRALEKLKKKLQD